MAKKEMLATTVNEDVAKKIADMADSLGLSKAAFVRMVLVEKLRKS